MGIIFVILILLVYASANYYIGLRSYRAFLNYLPGINAIVFWVFFIFIVVSYIAAALLRNYLPGFLDSTFNYIGAYWLAAFIYLIVLFSLNDLIFIIIKRIKGVSSGERLSNIFAMACIGIILLVAAVMVYGTIHADNTKIASYDINVDKNCGNLKDLNIVMVSDIHIGQVVGKKRIESMVNSINALKPDIVLLAGDIVDSDMESYIKEDAKDIFKNLKSTYGTYGVLGNHEYISGKPDMLQRLYEESGIKVLRDSSVSIGNDFYVVGRDDVSGQRFRKAPRKELHELLNGFDMTKPVILLDHQPGNLGEPEKEKVDLQLSGHTHGGQFFPSNLITKEIYKIDWGYLKYKNLNVIVSSGFGTWGPPIRIGTDSEIVNVHIHFKK